MTSPTNSSNAVILERVEGIRCDLAKIDTLMTTHIEQERKAREAYLIEHAAVVQKADAAHRRLDVLEPTVLKLQETINYLRDATKANTEAQKAQTQRLSMIFTALAFICTVVFGWVLNQILSLL